MWFPIVDVRDVARGHVLAATVPEAAGERFLLASDPAMSLQQMGAVLRGALGPAARHAPTRAIPDFVIRLAGKVRPEMASIVPDLGHARVVSSDKARRVLGWEPRPSREAVIAAGESMVARSLVTA